MEVQDTIKESSISFDYIRGLVEGEGTFTFSTITQRKRLVDGVETVKRRRVPAFAIKMHVRDKRLLEKVRDRLGLRNKVYEYNHQKNDGYQRGAQAMLIVREIGQLRNVVIPLFYKRFEGNKGIQFNEWLEKIGNDPEVPESYRFLYILHKSGFFDKNRKFID